MLCDIVQTGDNGQRFFPYHAQSRNGTVAEPESERNPTAGKKIQYGPGAYAAWPNFATGATKFRGPNMAGNGSINYTSAK